MAGKYLTLDEAAQQLGMSPDELNALRDKREISGYRDGKSWKFKTSDVEKLGENLKSGSSDDDGDDFGLSLDDDLELAVEPTTNEPEIDLSDELSLPDDDEIGLADEPAAKSDKPATKAEQEDELQLADDADLKFASDDDELKLADDDDLQLAAEPVSSAKTNDDDELSLTLDDDLSFAASDDSASDSSASEELSLADDDDLELAPEPSSSTSPSESLDLDLDDLGGNGSGDDAAEVVLGDDDAPATAAAEESLVLDDPEEAELTFDSGDSGISLLDESAASVELSFEDDDGADALSDDLDEDLLLGGSSGATGSSEDDSDFQLTPFDELDSDLSDSGSQVIQLDSGEEMSGLSGELEEMPVGEFEAVADDDDFGAATAAPAVAAGSAAAAAAPAASTESQFSGLDVAMLMGSGLLSLVAAFAMLQVAGAIGSSGGGSTILDPLVDVLFGG